VVEVARLKTKLGLVLIDRDKEMPKKRMQQISKAIPQEQITEIAIFSSHNSSGIR
jgi:hypothetical protein